MKKLIHFINRYFLIIFGILVVLWLIGGRTHTYQVETAINAAPEKIFMPLAKATISRLSAGQFRPDPCSISSIQTGLRFHREFDSCNMRWIIDTEITRYEANRVIEWRDTGNVADMLATIELEPVSKNTQLKYKVQIKHHDPYIRLLSPFLSGFFQREAEESVKLLKQNFEANN